VTSAALEFILKVPKLPFGNFVGIFQKTELQGSASALFDLPFQLVDTLSFLEGSNLVNPSLKSLLLPQTCFSSCINLGFLTLSVSEAILL